MPDIRKCKGLLGLVLVIVLLSFFYSAFNNLNIKADIAVAWNETGEEEWDQDEKTSHTVMLTSAENRLPESAARIMPAPSTMKEFESREQNASDTQLVRFLTVALIILFVAHVTLWTVIRHYGYRMIALWENIVYIHEVDGKKGERFSVYIVS